MQRTPKYNPRRVNRYVPQMQFSADYVHEGPVEVAFGPVAVASAINIINAQSINGGVTFLYGNPTASGLLIENTDPVTSAEFPQGPGFGRALQIVASGASAAAVTIYGRDYLGQPMSEGFTLNGTNPVLGKKAFKWIDSVVAASSNVNLSVGTQDALGLPFATQNVLAEQSNGARVGTLGTLVSAVLTDPQTSTTGDPRGTYDPQTTLDGSAYISATFIPYNRLNANGNGGLHGIQHFR